MSQVEPSWAVIVHNDGVNTPVGVAYAVHQVYGLPAARGLELAFDADEDGSACLTRCETREQAEEIVVEFQMLGVHATVEESGR